MTQDFSSHGKWKFDSISYSAPSEVMILPFCREYEAVDSLTSVLNEMKEILKDSK